MKILDNRLEAIKGPTGTFIKFALLRDGLKRYMIFGHLSTGKLYIEEIWATTSGDLSDVAIRFKRIENDEEWNTVFKFAIEHKLMAEERQQEVFGYIPFKITKD